MREAEFDARLKSANEELKRARMRVRIERRRQALYLRATLPPRPGSTKTVPHQQLLSLKISASYKGLTRAIVEARKMATQLDLKEFSWDQWIDVPKIGAGMLGKDAVERFTQYKRPSVKASTWEKVYKYALKKIPSEKPLDLNHVRQLIACYPVDSRMRQQWLSVFSQLLTFNSIEFDFSDLTGTYKLPSNPRHIPSDEEIVAMRNGIKNPGHQYIFGLLAAYGLRDHEVFFLDPQALKEGTAVVMGGKTGDKGPRQVWPYHPEWWEEWELWDYDRLPKYKARISPEDGQQLNSDYGQRITQFFWRSPVIKCIPYALRDRWSLRTLEYQVPVELASRQMGHSVEVHTQKYHFWIDAATQDRIHKQLIQRSDRPRPPSAGA